MNFQQKLKNWQDLLNLRLEQALPASSVQPEVLHQAMRHSMNAGGKRLRPILVLAAHEIFPNPVDPLPAAIAIECIHTYSLIHDDLPAMDNSDLRNESLSTSIRCQKMAQAQQFCFVDFFLPLSSDFMSRFDSIVCGLLFFFFSKSIPSSCIILARDC